MAENWDKNVVPLAIKPVTLNFILNIYRRNGRFSENQTLCDLYIQGCRILCDEDDPENPRCPGHKEENLYHVGEITLNKTSLRLLAKRGLYYGCSTRHDIRARSASH